MAGRSRRLSDIIDGRDGGSVLRLKPTLDVPVRASFDTIMAAGHASGHDLLRKAGKGEVKVYGYERQMTAETWRGVSMLLLMSRTSRKAFYKDAADLWDLFHCKYEEILQLPWHIYGHISHEPAPPTLHLLACCDFRPTSSSFATHFALLSGPDARLYQVWVHLGNGNVAIETAVVPGHFIDEGPGMPEFEPMRP